MTYTGNHISGTGDKDWLELIDKSFSMLHSSPVLPNLKMLYKSTTDMFSEGFIWGTGWWIQNSYGFTMGAIPLLDPFWSKILQNSYDAFWKRIGDGKRIGADSGIASGVLDSLCAPDGALGDCVSETYIAYRQGDGDVQSYDWFYEATAAGVHMQAEMLLFDRRLEMLQKYIPLLWRSLNHIESARAENGLFLVGPAANLLAPSYGGSYNAETGEVGKGYLTGISVTYAAALRKFIELLKMTGDTAGVEDCTQRLQRTLDALPLLLSDEGYFVKSMDPNGTKHGVYGAEKYGYLEAVCNIDAIAWNVADDRIANTIYRKIASVPDIRPAGTLCNNYPHLDDTFPAYQNHHSGPDSLGFKSGNWVDGGCWGTVEGRAILAYMRLGKTDDAFNAAAWYMRWAEEYRQDAPLTQWGWNSNNDWAQENDEHTVCARPAAIMIDNFAAVTCLLRGLFAYTADAEGLVIKPQIPSGITSITQHEPIHFAGCSIYITYIGGTAHPVVHLDGTALSIQADGSIHIPATLLLSGKTVSLHIDCSEEGTVPVSIPREIKLTGDTNSIPEELQTIYHICHTALKTANDPIHKAHLLEILTSVEAADLRRRLPFDKHDLRPMNDERKNMIIHAYDNTVLELYQGLKHRMRLLDDSVSVDQ